MTNDGSTSLMYKHMYKVIPVQKIHMRQRSNSQICTPLEPHHCRSSILCFPAVDSSCGNTLFPSSRYVTKPPPTSTQTVAASLHLQIYVISTAHLHQGRP